MCSGAWLWGFAFPPGGGRALRTDTVHREKMSLFCSCLCPASPAVPLVQILPVSVPMAPGLCKMGWTLRGWKGIRNYFLPSLDSLSSSSPGQALLQLYCRDVLQSPLCSCTQEPPDTKAVFEEVTLVRQSMFGSSGMSLSCWSPSPAGSPRWCLRVCGACLCLHGNARILIAE